MADANETMSERPIRADNAALPADAAASATAPARDAAPVLPGDALIILPMRNTVLFPGMVLPLGVGRERSIAAAQEAVRERRPIGLLLQRDAETVEPGPADLYEIGTTARILRYLTVPEGGHNVICQGEQRFRIVEFLAGYPFLAARVEMIEEVPATGSEIDARMHQLQQRAAEALKLVPNAPAELVASVQSIETPGTLADLVAGLIDLKPAEKQQVLETIVLRDRLDKVLWMLSYRIEVLRLSRDIGQQTQQTMESRQRDFLLREQLRAIQKELGEADEKSTEIAELEKKIAAAQMPEEVEAQAKRELRRLQRMPEGAAEYGMAHSYVEWLAELPWAKERGGAIDVAASRRILDEDHFGLAKVKKRILEYLAVRKLNPSGKGPILCFVGPPGVGKTSLGQSIARALDRPFVRVSLGGTHDEAEIRGHRRTYIGALPGNIIQAIRRAGTRDPVMMLDEIDKLGRGIQGDPSSAMLEVLDPAQNSTFRDNYLGVPFDLSKVLFIATANMLDTISGPLRDRMEVIELSSYTDAEKMQIARRYLVKRQLEQNGLAAAQAEITDAALARVIGEYTREAGVRNLEREIGALLRHAAMRIAEGEAAVVRIDAGDVPGVLGPHRFQPELAERTSVPGVATGLAWTPVGGDILFIEAALVPGSGRLILTGQLGDVMKESAQAALSLVKSKYRTLDLDPASFEKNDIHVHVPAGAIPKDGPSAGVAMFTALASLLTGRSVRADTAMTGEISLRGLVLPVGGIKEKVLAAQHAGVKRVMLPARNRKDWEDIPEEARKALEFVWLDRVDDALAAAIDATVRTAVEPAAE
jgi:ATP-dependent Lon protease